MTLIIGRDRHEIRKETESSDKVQIGPKPTNLRTSDVSGDDNAEQMGDMVYDELGVVCPPHTTERHLVRRIDTRLMPFVIIMYLLAFLDRVNIANAKTFHLVDDLHLTGTQYNTGMWYKRSEAQKRYSLFFSSTSLAGAFGGLLASAIGKMDGVRGYHGWRWIFILEGVLTVLVAFVFFFFFPSFPEQAPWLREDEREYVRARLQADQGHSAAERKVGFRDVVNVMKDYKVWLGGLMYFGLIVPAYGYAFFAPQIIKTYQFDAIQTQLRSVPPWAVSFVFSLIIAAFSDWFRHRALFAIVPLCLSITGFSILISVHNNLHLEYAALFLVVMGTYGAMPIIVCWFNMNLGGHHRRSIGVAWQVGFGNIGGIIATYAFIDTDAPYYVKGYSIAIAFTALSGLASVAYFVSLLIENRRRAKSVRDVGLTDYEKSELGDLNPEFKYMY
ncbi:hypothetical protein E8E14_013591 [Neopestalotiopsis sp. 37M]|nr:hypothetical protein E8E14_013591 [Neopestalotiopsis sp. 37M]